MVSSVRVPLVLLSCALCVMSCGSAWDGEYVPREELGDWRDEGPLAACRLAENAQGACGDLSTFDLSACNRDTFGQLEHQGVFRTVTRFETKYPSGTRITGGGGGFRLAPDGLHSANGTSIANLEDSQLDARTFYLASTSRTSTGSTIRHAFVGCEARSAYRLTGCYVRCADGVMSTFGTFDGERMRWREGEAEASGLKLASETRVELGEPVDVYVTKDHAYVVSINKNGKTGGLTVFDVEDREHPVLRKTVELPGDSYWNGVWAKDDALYVASNRRGVLVFDISTPAEPKLLRGVPSDALNVHTVFVDGDRLYAMSPSPDAETLIFDISKPTDPTLLSRYVMDAWNSAYPHDAFVYEDRLYINNLGKDYEVVDVKDPANPRSLGAYSYEGSASHANAVGTFGGRTIAFEGGERVGAHLRVLDVTDPGDIKLVAEHKLRSTTSIHNMVLRDERLYVAWYHEGIRVLDVSNPSQPREIAHYNTFRETDPGRTDSLYEGAIGMRVPGDGYVYAVDVARGLLILPEP